MLSAYLAQTLDPLSFLDLPEDFATGGTTTGNVGSTGWSIQGGTVTQIDGEGDHPGIRRLATGGTINTIARLVGNTGTSNDPIHEPQWALTQVFRVNQATLQEVRIGWAGNFGAAPPIEGLYLEWDTAVSPFWVCVARTGSVSARAVTTLVALPNTWYRLRLVREGGPVRFELWNPLTRVYDLLATMADQIPGGALQPGFQIENLEAADKTLDADYARLQVWGMVR